MQSIFRTCRSSDGAQGTCRKFTRKLMSRPTSRLMAVVCALTLSPLVLFPTVASAVESVVFEATGQLAGSLIPTMSVTSDDSLLGLVGIARVQSTEDFALNTIVYVYETESIVDPRTNSRSLIVVIKPLDPGSQARAFALGIGIHTLFTIDAENGLIVIQAEKFTGFQPKTFEPKYEFVTLEVFYKLDPTTRQPAPTIELRER